jgi:oxygen-independent coproporphyrinogen-3 oxidase
MLPDDLLAEVSARLVPLTGAGVAELRGNRLVIPVGGLPYARVIAALFDAYRAITPRVFSSAI